MGGNETKACQGLFRQILVRKGEKSPESLNYSACLITCCAAKTKLFGGTGGMLTVLCSQT